MQASDLKHYPLRPWLERKKKNLCRTLSPKSPPAAAKKNKKIRLPRQILSDLTVAVSRSCLPHGSYGLERRHHYRLRGRGFLPPASSSQSVIQYRDERYIHWYMSSARDPIMHARCSLFLFWSLMQSKDAYALHISVRTIEVWFLFCFDQRCNQRMHTCELLHISCQPIVNK